MIELGDELTALYINKVKKSNIDHFTEISSIGLLFYLRK